MLQSGQQDFAHWIGAIPAGSEISLYLHVPFCRRLCWFCACRTQGTTSDEPVQRLCRDAEGRNCAACARICPRRHASAPALGRGHADAAVRRHDARSGRQRSSTRCRWPTVANFRSRSTRTRSTLPGLMRWPPRDEPRLDRGAGFRPEIQKTIGRDQSYDLTRDVAEMIRARGVRQSECRHPLRPAAPDRGRASRIPCRSC